MNRSISYLLVMVVGMVAGMWLCRSYHFRDDTKKVQVDSVVIYDTVRYSRLDLGLATTPLDVFNVSAPELVFIPDDSTSIIYRDSVRYVTLPRQYFFTETEDTQIWHSGIDSRIDSLNVFHKTKTVTQTVRQHVTKRNALSIGVDLNYSDALYAPVQLEYSYNALPWLSVYGYAEYELFRKQFGIGAGTRVRIGW